MHFRLRCDDHLCLTRCDDRARRMVGVGSIVGRRRRQMDAGLSLHNDLGAAFGEFDLAHVLAGDDPTADPCLIPHGPGDLGLQGHDRFANEEHLLCRILGLIEHAGIGVGNRDVADRSRRLAHVRESEGLATAFGRASGFSVTRSVCGSGLPPVPY